MLEYQKLTVKPCLDGVCLEISCGGEKVGAHLDGSLTDSLAEAMSRGDSFWIDNDEMQIGFSHLILYISAEFVVLGDKSKKVAEALKSRKKLVLGGL